MQVRVSPVQESAFAIERRTAEMDDLILIDGKLDIASDEQMMAPRAKARLIERPPLLERIVNLQKLELPAECGEERLQRLPLFLWVCFDIHGRLGG
jgi:hypothetical protein